MCARYVITSPPAAIRALFGYDELPNFPPRYNVAPTQPIPIVRLVDGRRHFALVRWGFIPAWVKDPKKFSLLVNARGESVLEKPAFRNAMRRRRCLIPADGFYDWRDGVPRRPYFVRQKNSDGPMAFAGVWESWTGPNGEESTPPQSSPRGLTPPRRRSRPDAGRRSRRRPLIFGSIAPRSRPTAAALIAPAPQTLARKLRSLDRREPCRKRRPAPYRTGGERKARSV